MIKDKVSVTRSHSQRVPRVVVNYNKPGKLKVVTLRTQEHKIND